MKLGFVGTGALTSAIVTGLKSVAGNALSIVVSPRNAEIAASLAVRYPDVRVAPDNQAVLDGCDTVMLAVRPQIAHEVLSDLRFRSDHQVISLIATLSLEQVRVLAAPAQQVTKALPMPMVAHKQGATLVFPPNASVAALFGTAGKVIELNDAAEFDALSVVTATFATYFKYLDTIQQWLKDHGVPDTQARNYILTIYKALSNAPATRPDVSLMHLASEEYATRGGINEQVLRELTTGKMFETLAKSMDGVHRRITGEAAS